jgi:hypothetical protein
MQGVEYILSEGVLHLCLLEKRLHKHAEEVI